MRLLNLFKTSPAPSAFVKSDTRFNRLYPPEIRFISQRHWTPLRVVRLASKFLARENNAKILDIGSGIGKFCLAAALQQPGCSYYGIEQRQRLIDEAEKVKQLLKVPNVSFIHGNITTIDFSCYDHFYFFNSFYENLEFTDKIDFDIEYSQELYDYYSNYLYEQLQSRPAGTRLATYHAKADQVPPGYRLHTTAFDNLFQCWVRE